jgi:hypothetical protein
VEYTGRPIPAAQLHQYEWDMDEFLIQPYVGSTVSEKDCPEFNTILFGYIQFDHHVIKINISLLPNSQENCFNALYRG